MTEPISDDDEALDAEPTRTLLTSYAEYDAAIEAMLGLATEEILVFDPDGAQLGFDRKARAAQLAAFLERSPTSRIRLAVHDEAWIASRCPRLIALMRDFAGRVHVHRTEDDARRAQDCFVVVDHDDCVRRPVAGQPRGVALRAAPHEVALQRVRFEEIWENSVPAVSATTLGL
jgi:hypothetical protein